MSDKKLLLICCAGLDGRAIHGTLLEQFGLPFREIKGVYPAVTCPVQATMRTALPPKDHGMICNGRYDRRSCRVEFWGQSSRYIDGGRLWDGISGKSAVLFHQQSLGDSADIVLSPAPIHCHNGGMISSLYTKPMELETNLRQKIGKFPLHRYWGPMANFASTQWCANATIYVLQQFQPRLAYTYLPHLDYILQKEGPFSPHLPNEVNSLAKIIQKLLQSAEELNYACCIYGDYSMETAENVIFPNRFLREKGYFCYREVNGMTYPDLYASRAFALCDHQIAQIYVKDSQDLQEIRNYFCSMSGIDNIKSAEGEGFSKEIAGDFILKASQGSWFAYPWWSNPKEAPDYAGHVDIHQKIGYDPCELFWDIPLFRTSQNPSKIRGTHGRGTTQPIFAVTKDAEPLGKAESHLELAKAAKAYLQGD